MSLPSATILPALPISCCNSTSFTLTALFVGDAAAGALDARAGRAPALVHGIARGGCRAAVVIGRAG